MNLVKSSVEIIPQEFGLSGVYKQIEIAARTCYKSEDKICEGSAKRMVDFLIEKEHYSPLEHGTIYLKVPNGHGSIEWYNQNPYSKVNTVGPYTYITTNARVIMENDCTTDLKFMCEPTKHHEKRVTVRFKTQIAISREANRSRSHSISEQSTRYCNYSKDKFDNSISVSLPTWINENNIKLCQGSNDLKSMCEDIASNETKWWTPLEYWLFANLVCEYSYMNLIKLGWTPEKARVVLPLDTHTEVVYTAFVSDWKHFFKLRTSNAAHPDIKELACSLQEKFITMGIK